MLHAQLYLLSIADMEPTSVPQMELLIKEEHFFEARAHSLSLLKAIKNIKEKINEEHLCLFKGICFGHFLKISNLGFCGPIIHHLLLREA